jgi:putative copper export protein/methionine-rich copper-binding protein CopC
VIRRVLCLLGVLGALLLTATPAYAHADLAGSDPRNGASLKALPDKATLTFTGGVSGDFSQVRLGAAKLPLSQPKGKQTVLVADLSKLDPKPAGSVKLNWRVISLDDGHVIDGVVEFKVRGGEAAAAKSPVQADPPTQQEETAAVPTLDPKVRYGYLAARGVGYLALALFLGGLVFVSVLWPAGAAERRTRRVLALACGLGAASSLVSIGFQGAFAELRPLADVVRPAVFGPVLVTHVGQVLAAKTLLWLLGAVVLTWLLQRDRLAVTTNAWRVGAAAIGFGLVATTGMSSHAAETSTPAVSQIADLVHLVGMSTWIGGLVLLLLGVLPRRRPDELAAVMPKYSTLALTSVVAIAAAGTVLAWQLIGSVGDLFTTSYGRLLLVKLAVVVLVLGVAQRSKAWVGRKLRYAVVLGADRATVRPLMFSVMAETGLLLGVLAVAVLLVTANPGR